MIRALAVALLTFTGCGRIHEHAVVRLWMQVEVTDAHGPVAARVKLRDVSAEAAGRSAVLVCETDARGRCETKIRYTYDRNTYPWTTRAAEKADRFALVVGRDRTEVTCVLENVSPKQLAGLDPLKSHVLIDLENRRCLQTSLDWF